MSKLFQNNPNKLFSKSYRANQNNINQSVQDIIDLYSQSSSYINNHKLMLKHDGYDSSIHSRLFRGLIRHKALGAYVSIMLRPLLIHFLLLVYPKLLVKIKRRHPGDAT